MRLREARLTLISPLLLIDDQARTARGRRGHSWMSGYRARTFLYLLQGSPLCFGRTDTVRQSGRSGPEPALSPPRTREILAERAGLQDGARVRPIRSFSS